jgi:hypothetical protein
MAPLEGDEDSDDDDFSADLGARDEDDNDADDDDDDDEEVCGGEKSTPGSGECANADAATWCCGDSSAEE